MLELLEFAFQGINLFPTILLIFVILYWLIVILGVIDIDSIDFDLDGDLDVDADLDGDIELGGLSSVLSFFNIGQMPLMIFVTFFTLPFWAITLLANDFFGTSSSVLGFLLLFGGILVSLFVAKFLTTPIAKFYMKVRENTEAIKDIVGQICTAKLPVGSDKSSQAEIKINGTSVLINARTQDGNTVAKGETALVISFQEDQNFYYIEPYKF